MKCFSYLTLLSQRMGGGHDRIFAAQLFAPRIPPGRTLGRYPRLCGLLMTTGYSDVKVPKNNPFTVRSREGVNLYRFSRSFFKEFFARQALCQTLASRKPFRLANSAEEMGESER